MNTKSSKQDSQLRQKNSLMSLDQMDGSLSKLLSGIQHIITTSQGSSDRISINVTVNVYSATGGGAKIVIDRET